MGVQTRSRRTQKRKRVESPKTEDFDDAECPLIRTKKGKRKHMKPSCGKQDPSLEKYEEVDGKTSCERKLNKLIEESTYYQNDILGQILQAKKTFPTSCQNYRVVKPVATFSSSIVHYFSQTGLGLRPGSQWKQGLYSPVQSLVSDLQLLRTASAFDRRCTAMEWHPTRPGVIAVGSKGGDIILWDTNNTENDLFIPGKGAGGSIQAIKFAPGQPEQVLTASIDGTVAIHDFRGRHNRILLDTLNCYDFWYCSVDIQARRNMIAAGDNVGNVTLMSSEGNKIMMQRLHKQKVTHTEFSNREDWLLCTASNDHTVQLWDVRMIKDRKSALHVLQHNKPINSACFNQTNGMRLLTTDQHHELRVYQAPFWTLERTIVHPHRFFQHITPIKASWHPLQDLIVVGRYPDQNLPGHIEGERRTIDMYDADSGNLCSQLHDPGAPGLISLNKFNPQGDSLASTMGLNVLLWSRKEEVIQKQEALMAAIKQQGFKPEGQSQPRRHKPQMKHSKDSTQKQKNQKLANLKLKSDTKKRK